MIFFHLCIHDILRLYNILTIPVNSSSAYGCWPVGLAPGWLQETCNNPGWWCKAVHSFQEFPNSRNDDDHHHHHLHQLINVLLPAFHISIHTNRIEEMNIYQNLTSLSFVIRVFYILINLSLHLNIASYLYNRFKHYYYLWYMIPVGSF